MRPAAPKGFRDVLPQEAEERDALSSALAGIFRSWGYRPVQTPVVEERQTFESAAGAALTRESFTLVDTEGELLVLRPEMTVPIARLVASRLADEPGPFRLMYFADVFREQESLRGQAREFAQAGVELLGPAGPEADAELVSLLVQSLRASGLSDFSVGVGTVEVVRALIGAAEMPEDWGRDLMEAAQRRNLVEVGRLASDENVPGDVSSALTAVFRVRGGAEALEECRKLLMPLGLETAVERIARVWALLEETGVAADVTLDFGLLRSFDYYTGLVMEAYAPGIGLPLGGGGRYDEVLAAFGRPMPAAGFALGLERLHIAASEQGAELGAAGLDAMIGGPDVKGAYLAAAELRAEGLRVELAEGLTREQLAERAAERSQRALWAEDGRVEEVP